MEEQSWTSNHGKVFMDEESGRSTLEAPSVGSVILLSIFVFIQLCTEASLAGNGLLTRDSCFCSAEYARAPCYFFLRAAPPPPDRYGKRSVHASQQFSFQI